MSRRRRSPHARHAALVALPLLAAASPAAAGGDLTLPIPIDQFPNAVGIGVGFAPNWLGASDYFFGGAPAATLQTPIGRLNLVGNYLFLNILDERFDQGGFTFGPSAVYRFGRSDVEDPVVAKLPEVDDALSVGVTLGYAFVTPGEPLKRIDVSADLTFDVTEGDGGAALGLSARVLRPLPWRGGAVAALAAVTLVNDDQASRYSSISAASSAASGLPVFDAGAGARDVRVGVGIIQSVSLNWHLGAGVVYSRLLGDTADSPIVAQRGDANQFLFGVGAAYAWGFSD